MERIKQIIGMHCGGQFFVIDCIIGNVVKDLKINV